MILMPGRPYKRAFDVAVAAVGIVVSSPVIAIAAVLIKLEDGGPIFFRQTRVGQGGQPFKILKLRTMVVTPRTCGALITVGGDRRITQIGRFLRKIKFDELPQFFNVLTGDMSVVGPRPEVPTYVALYTREQRKVLEYRPGITDIASLEFINEEEILKAAADPERCYLEQCMPRKIELNLRYAEQATFWTDLIVVWRTAAALGRANR